MTRTRILTGTATATATATARRRTKRSHRRCRRQYPSKASSGSRARSGRWRGAPFAGSRWTSGSTSPEPWRPTCGRSTRRPRAPGTCPTATRSRACSRSAARSRSRRSSSSGRRGWAATSTSRSGSARWAGQDPALEPSCCGLRTRSGSATRSTSAGSARTSRSTSETGSRSRSSSMLARSPHVAYTNIIEALLRCVVAARGAMLLHSACVEIDGRGVMLSRAHRHREDRHRLAAAARARRAVPVRRHDGRWMPDGTAHCFPKPLTISHHTLRAVDPGDLPRTEWLALGLQSRLHSKGGRGIGMRLGEMNMPIMTANALTQIAGPAAEVRRRPARRLRDRSASTKVEELFIIERGAPALSRPRGRGRPRRAGRRTPTTPTGSRPTATSRRSWSSAAGVRRAARARARGPGQRDARTSACAGWRPTDFGWADEIPRLAHEPSGRDDGGLMA